MEKYILTFITLLITSLSFAQLTVRDNAYIFIDGDGFSSEVTGTPVATDIAPLFVTDDIRIEATGKQIFKKTNLSNSTRYEFNTKNLSDGTYITIITLDNNSSLNKKIIIQNN